VSGSLLGGGVEGTANGAGDRGSGLEAVGVGIMGGGSVGRHGGFLLGEEKRKWERARLKLSDVGD
jgi:hypothetical protein